ncbi:MAG: 1-(5-phosphoribosyl)-5-[(5-phosphoribosylamino)methylideneamino]imidazole-4-carboxamide isomerase [Desulfohalobiaceae bacterium]
MIVFPALDIKNGECVRLKQGKADEVTVFGSDPVEMARQWAREGASWLHVVDLDGAFQGVPVNYELIRSICAAAEIPIQLGGGIRDRDTAESYFQAGVTRLVLGTLAMEDRQALRELCQRYPGRIGVSLDADKGRLKSRGWVEDSGLTVFEVLPELESIGVAFAVYTDISRDGMQSGIDLDTVDALLDTTELPLVVAGGIDSMEHIRALYPFREKGLSGVITGKAIYSGSLDFWEAVQWLDSREAR